MRYPSTFGAVVTGAGSGLGRALALDLAARGARVLVSDIDPDGLAETVGLLEARGAEVHSTPCDVAQWEDVQALARTAEETVGPVDVLCNNAGVAVGGTFEDVSLEDFRWCVEIDLWGVIYGCKAFLPGMRERGRGWVLNVASAAGLLSAPEMAAYNVSKTGVVSLTETLYAEYAGTGVKVAALCPTFFPTKILDSMRGPIDGRAQRTARKLMDRSALSAADIARVGLDGLEKGELHIVPMRDGKLMWLFKRLRPQAFHDALGPGRRGLIRFLK